MKSLFLKFRTNTGAELGGRAKGAVPPSGYLGGLPQRNFDGLKIFVFRVCFFFTEHLNYYEEFS